MQKLLSLFPHVFAFYCWKVMFKYISIILFSETCDRGYWKVQSRIVASKTKLVLATSATILLLLALFLGTMVQAKPNSNGPKLGDPGFSGPHFNLNIHGVPDGVDKIKNDSAGSGRHSIFIPLDTDNNSITMLLAVATDPNQNWTVVDCDATIDGTVSIILPRYVWVNITNGNGWTWEHKRVDYYNVYVAALGKPTDHKIIVEPQAEFDNVTNKVYYSWGTFDVPGHKNGKKAGPGGGQPKWQNVTRPYFFHTVTLWNGTDYVTYTDTWVFDIPLDGYWWEVKNEGVKLMQVRFYPVFKGNGNGNS